MRIAPESRRKALDASEAVGWYRETSEDFEAIQRVPTASDAETIAELRRQLAESEADRERLFKQLAAMIWRGSDDGGPVRIGFGESAK
jgi:hypothetical protein